MTHTRKVAIVDFAWNNRASQSVYDLYFFFVFFLASFSIARVLRAPMWRRSQRKKIYIQINKIKTKAIFKTPLTFNFRISRNALFFLFKLIFRGGGLSEEIVGE